MWLNSGHWGGTPFFTCPRTRVFVHRSKKCQNPRIEVSKLWAVFCFCTIYVLRMFLTFVWKNQRGKLYEIQISVSKNKVLLAHSLISSFTYCLQCFHATMAKLSSCKRDQSTKIKGFPTWPFADFSDLYAKVRLGSKLGGALVHKSVQGRLPTKYLHSIWHKEENFYFVILRFQYSGSEHRITQLINSSFFICCLDAGAER